MLLKCLILLSDTCNDSGQSKSMTWNVLEAIWCQPEKSSISGT